MVRVTEIRLADKSYDSMLFSLDSDYVSTFNEHEETDETFVTADKVFIKTGETSVNAKDFIRSLTDEDLKRIETIVEEDEITYLLKAGI